MYESSGSQFVRNTTGIQSEPHAFDVSRFFMTFENILAIAGILCNFRLILDEKTGKDVPESSILGF